MYVQEGNVFNFDTNGFNDGMIGGDDLIPGAGEGDFYWGGTPPTPPTLAP